MFYEITLQLSHASACLSEASDRELKKLDHNVEHLGHPVCNDVTMQPEKAHLQRQRKADWGGNICTSKDLQIILEQDTSATVSSTLEGYLKAPLEEFKCLRCFENVRIHLSNFNTGFGISTSKAPTLMTRLPRLSWRWSDVISLRHQAPPMLRGCFRMEAWWLLTTGQAFQEKNWTRSSFWGRMPWWQTLTLAGFEKEILCQ